MFLARRVIFGFLTPIMLLSSAIASRTDEEAPVTLTGTVASSASSSEAARGVAARDLSSPFPVVERWLSRGGT